ncbi:Clathrin/coatomer adaptor adaptin-like N-terminal domain-containing protein [Plasmodiophora brassicae]
MPGSIWAAEPLRPGGGLHQQLAKLAASPLDVLPVLPALARRASPVDARRVHASLVQLFEAASTTAYVRLVIARTLRAMKPSDQTMRALCATLDSTKDPAWIVAVLTAIQGPRDERIVHAVVAVLEGHVSDDVIAEHCVGALQRVDCGNSHIAACVTRLISRPDLPRHTRLLLQKLDSRPRSDIHLSTQRPYASLCVFTQQKQYDALIDAVLTVLKSQEPLTKGVWKRVAHAVKCVPDRGNDVIDALLNRNASSPEHGALACVCVCLVHVVELSMDSAKMLLDQCRAGLEHVPHRLLATACIRGARRSTALRSQFVEVLDAVVSSAPTSLASYDVAVVVIQDGAPDLAPLADGLLARLDLRDVRFVLWVKALRCICESLVKTTSDIAGSVCCLREAQLCLRAMRSSSSSMDFQEAFLEHRIALIEERGSPFGPDARRLGAIGHQLSRLTRSVMSLGPRSRQQIETLAADDRSYTAFPPAFFVHHRPNLVGVKASISADRCSIAVSGRFRQDLVDRVASVYAVIDGDGVVPLDLDQGRFARDCPFRSDPVAAASVAIVAVDHDRRRWEVATVVPVVS